MLYLCAFPLLFASWLQPLHFLPWVSWHSEILAFMAVLCLMWQVVRTLKTVGIAPSLPVAALPILGLGVLIGMQWACGLIPFAGDVVVYWTYLLLCLASMFLGYHSARERPQWLMWMAHTVLAGALASAVVALLQTLELSQGFAWIHSMGSWRRPGANLGQPNQLATLLLMGLGSLLFLLESRKFGMVPASLMALLLTMGLAATESRAGALGFIVLSLWGLAKHKSIGFQRIPWGVVLVGLVFLGFYWNWSSLMAEVFQIQGGSLPINSVAYSRWIIWPQLLQAVFLRPWWGWGVGQVSTAHNAVVDAYSASEAYTYAHNILLDGALGIGLPLSGLLMILLGAWLWRRIQAVQQLEQWYCLALVIPVAVHSLVEFPFAYAYFLVPVMFALGALEGLIGSKPILMLRVKKLAPGLILMTSLFIWSSIEYLAIENDFRIVRFEALRMGQTPQSYERPTVHLFTQLDALLYGGRIVPRPEMPAPEIELARKVALRYPWPATQNRYALSLALNGDPQEAVRQLRVMRAQHGPQAYKKIKDAWILMANEQFPQLLALKLP